MASESTGLSTSTGGVYTSAPTAEERRANAEALEARRAEAERQAADNRARMEAHGFEPKLLSILGTGMVALTPGAVLALLRVRLSDVDGQIDGMMKEIEVNSSRSEALQRRVEGLTQIQSAMASMNAEGNEDLTLKDIHVTWNDQTWTADELLNHLGIHDLAATNQDPEGLRLAGERSQIERRIADGSATPEDLARHERVLEAQAIWRADGHAYNGEDKLKGKTLEPYIQQLQSQARRMNSGNEMLMVQMQSAMQQRSQAVSLATQMMKSINDSSAAVTQNIGR